MIRRNSCHIKIHVDLMQFNRRSMPVWCTLTVILIRSSEGIKGNIQGHKSSS